jgi:NTP pyrophosphatase (non-canonical NTP hydrolase)
MDLRALQDLMRDLYENADKERGVPSTVAWLTEELGELAQAVRKGDIDQQTHEIADVLAWLASLANQLDIDLEEAMIRFASGCPKCGKSPCICD